MDTKMILIICMLMAGQLTFSRGQTYQNLTQLKTDLFTGYDSTVIPKNNLTEVMNITIALTIYSIWDVDPINGIYSVMAGPTVGWTDERMVWTPASYGGLSYLKVTQDSVWTPSIVPTNAMGMVDLGEKWMMVKYQPNGTAVWSTAQCLILSCSFKMRYWPFDKQICYIKFTLFNQALSEAEMHNTLAKAILTFYSPHAEWDLEDTFSYRIEYDAMAELVYGLKLVRQSTYYSLTIIIPLVSLNLMSALVFLLPAESGERIGYNITIMLSIVVFLILIGDHVPKTSNPMPLICGFLITLVTLSIMCLVGAILSLSLYHCEDDLPESSLYRTLVHLMNNPCRRRKNKANNITEKPVKDTNKANDKIKFGIKTGAFKNKVDIVDVLDLDNKETLADLKRNNSFFEDRADEPEITWKDVSKAFDKLFFTLFLLATVVPSVVIPVYMATTSSYPE